MLWWPLAAWLFAFTLMLTRQRPVFMVGEERWQSAAAREPRGPVQTHQSMNVQVEILYGLFGDVGLKSKQAFEGKLDCGQKTFTTKSLFTIYSRSVFECRKVLMIILKLSFFFSFRSLIDPDNLCK